jgi:hypothetical protein
MTNNKKIISELNKAINSESRKEKVQAIFEHSGDELEDLNDWIEIAEEEKSGLNERLQNIIEYYDYNDNKIIQFKDGFIWKDVTKEAKEAFKTFPLYRVNQEEETEALIETIEDLNEAIERDCKICIEIGYINKPTIEEEREKHQKVREILQSYNNPEYGDCIVDEICFIFGAATTTDTEEEQEINLKY